MLLSQSPSPAILEDDDFMESNKMHQVNGFMYGNMDGLKVCKDTKVLWHAFAVGTEVDMHGIYFHGNSFSSDRGIHKDSLALFPGISIFLWQLSICPYVSNHYASKFSVTDTTSGTLFTS